MNIDIQLDTKNSLIRLKATGLLSQDARKGILLAVAEQLRRSDLSRVVVDLTETHFDPDEMMVGALELTKFMQSIGIKPEAKIAFIYSEAESHRKHFENVAQLGGFTIKYHKSFEEALRWLNW